MTHEFKFEFVCDQDWDAMEGDGAVRFCGECRRNVYNISEVDEATAARVAADPTECIRVRPAADGRVLQANGALWGVLIPVSIIAGCMNEPQDVPQVISVEAPVAQLEVLPVEPVKTVDPALRRPDRSTRVTFDEAMDRVNGTQSDRNAREGSFFQECEETFFEREPVRSEILEDSKMFQGIQDARNVRTGSKKYVPPPPVAAPLDSRFVYLQGRVDK